jgi:hypothetical protein
MPSASLYTTFGNEIKYEIQQDTLVAYLEDATIKFPLPEASSEILSELVDMSTINPVDLDVVLAKLTEIGFSKANGKAMAAVLISVAKSQGVSPMEYFEVNEASLKLTQDAYKTINMMRPAGNRIGLSRRKENKKSRYGNMIRP